LLKLLVYSLPGNVFRGILAQPRDKTVKAEQIRGMVPGNKSIRFFGARGDAHAIDCKKRIGGCERRPLVAIDERMVLRKAFPQRSGFFDQVCVVAGLWAE
jgi:hypothetical protein